MKTMKSTKHGEVLATGESAGQKVEIIVRHGRHKLTRTFRTFIRANGEAVRFPKFATFLGGDEIAAAVAIVKANASAVAWN